MKRTYIYHFNRSKGTRLLSSILWFHFFDNYDARDFRGDFLNFEHIRLRHCFVKRFKGSPMNGPIAYTKQFNLLVSHLSLLT